MRKFILSAASVFVLLAVWQASPLTATEATIPPKDALGAAPDANDLVRQALLAEADGNVAARSAKLRDALARSELRDSALAGRRDSNRRSLDVDR
jgi:hypothetical protein